MDRLLTDILRDEHAIIRSWLRKLEHSLALLIGAAERGGARVDFALQTARIIGAGLERIIPDHVEREDQLFARLAGTPVAPMVRETALQHSSVERAYQAFLGGLRRLDQTPEDPVLLREVAVLVHALADLLGRHMREEEEILFPAIEEVWSEGSPAT